MKKLLILFLLFFVFSACLTAQVRQYRSYLKISSPGNQMLDDNGVPVNSFIINRFLVLEIPKGQIIKFDKIVAGNERFSATGEKIKSNPYEAGKRYSNEKVERIYLQKKGDQLWKFNLVPIEGKPNEEVLKNIIITGKLNNKAFRLLIKSEIQLEGDQNY